MKESQVMKNRAAIVKEFDALVIDEVYPLVAELSQFYENMRIYYHGYFLIRVLQDSYKVLSLWNQQRFIIY